MDNKELSELLDHRAKTLVGTLLKRLEILEQESSFNHSLFRKLIKEHIYEEFRIIKLMLGMCTVIFKIKDENGKEN